MTDINPSSAPSEKQIVETDKYLVTTGIEFKKFVISVSMFGWFATAAMFVWELERTKYT